MNPVALRAYVTSYVNLCWVIGGFISAGILRGTVDRADQWAYRIPFALQWIWPVPIIIGVSFAPERYGLCLIPLSTDDILMHCFSPWWLVRKNRIEEARKALVSLTSAENTAYNVDGVLAMIQHTISSEEHVGQGT